MKALGHRAEHLAQADRLRRGKAERPDHLLLGQAEQPAARRRRAEHAGRAGDVPAAIVVRRVDGVADAALDFDAEHQRMQEVASRHRPRFGEREDRRTRPGRPGWMTVFRCVSSKSKTCELMPFISAACSMSIRSRRPSTLACGGPENGAARGSRYRPSRAATPPTAQPDPVQQRAARLARAPAPADPRAAR